MAPRITLPGAGAIDLDLQDARVLNVGLLTVEGTTTQDDVDASAAPRSYIDRGDLRFYDPTANYLTNQYVLFDNRIWFANRPVSGVEPGTSAADWTELSRNDAFITFAADTGSVMADGHESAVTIAGGTGIDTTADNSTETLTINLDAALDNLSDVSAASPATGYFLQYNGSAWVPAEVTGDGYNTVSDGTNTSSVTTSRQTIQFSGSGAVDVAVTQDTDSSNVTVSVEDATQTQAGLLSENDKRLLDDVRDGGWENNELLISTLPNVPGILLSDHLNMNISSLSLDELIRLNNLRDVDTSAADAGDVLTYRADGTWAAVHPQEIEDHGGRQWSADVNYSRGDIISFRDTGGIDRLFTSVTANNQGNSPITGGIVDTLNWQEASILRLRDIANVDITTDPANNDLLVWNASENDWVVMSPTQVLGLTNAITEGDIRTTLTNGRREISAINVGGTDLNFATTWRGEWRASEGANYRSLDVVIDGNNGSLFQLQPPSVPTDQQNVRPSLARRQTGNNNPLWELVSDTYFDDFNAAIVYDEGSIVHVNGNYYFKTQDGQAAGAGTLVTDTTAWHNLSENTTYTAGTGLTLTGTEFSVTNPYDPDSPLTLWDSSRTYDEGDMVLFDGGSNVNSIYIAAQAVAADNPPVRNGIDNDTDWHLVRSGLVSVQGPDDTVPAGITGNSTLRFNEGSGINITRSGTSFSISQHGTGHSDADEFGPGWAYSFYDLRNGDSLGAVDGAVEEAIGGFPATDVTLLTGSGVPVIQGTDNTSGLTNGNIYGFVTSAGAQNQALFPGDPATMRRIVYVAAIFAGGSVWNLAILNADPRFNTRGDLITGTGASTARTISTTFTLYPLSIHHDTPSDVPADWARQGNTDDIPGNKLGALDDAKPDNKADGTTLGVIDDTWLPADPLRTEYTQSDTVGENNFIVRNTDNNGWINADVDINRLSDVNLTRPTDESTDGPQQVIQWDGTNSEWINTTLAESASGRLEFTDRGNNIWDTTGFITDPSAPTDITPIRTTMFNEGLLRFQLATAANLALTVPDYPAFNWDQPVSGTLTATATRDALLNVDLTDLTTAASNVTISPSSGVGPWGVRYTDASQITSPAGATSTSGGSVAGVTFSAQYSNDATRMETDTGLGVRWLDTGLNVNNRNFGATRTFLQQYPSYNIPVSCNNISNNNTVTWAVVDGTYNAAATINGSTTASIGTGNNNIAVPFTVSHNDTVPTETVVAEFLRPTSIVPTARTFGVSGTVTNQPAWNYPFFIFSQAGTPTDPVAVTIRDATQAGTATTNPSDAIGNRVAGISLTNSGSNVRFLYVAYPAASSSAPDYDNNQPLTVRINTTISGSSNISDVTVAEANHSSASLNIFRDGGTAAEGEMYNWFRLRVGVNATVDILQVL